MNALAAVSAADPVTHQSSDPSQAATSAFGLGFDALLKIILTQLTYQDPLKPMDNFEFVSQLAQFSQIQQGQTTNDVLNGVGPWTDSCLCKPTGQIEALLRVWKFDDHLILATEQPEVLRARFEETVMLEDVALSKLGTPFACLQGPQTRRIEGPLTSDRTGSGGCEVLATEAPPSSGRCAPMSVLLTHTGPP